MLSGGGGHGLRELQIKRATTAALFTYGRRDVVIR